MPSNVASLARAVSRATVNPPGGRVAFRSPQFARGGAGKRVPPLKPRQQHRERCRHPARSKSQMVATHSLMATSETGGGISLDLFIFLALPAVPRGRAEYGRRGEYATFWSCSSNESRLRTAS